MLRQRAAYKRYFSKDAPFYSMFNIGTYTFETYKVVWTRVGTDIKGAVVSSASVAGINKPIVPIETAVLVAFNELAEAHYFCAILNSSPWRFVITSTGVHGTGGFGSPNVLKRARIPKFDPQDSLHLWLAELSEKAHKLAPMGDEIQLKSVQEEIDQRAAELWDITKTELEAIKRCLAEMG